LVPTIPSFDPLWRGPELPAGSLHTPGGFHSFEHRWALEPAFRFQLRLGRAAVAKRVHTLHDALKRELARRRGFRVRTPMGAELSAGIICFEVEKAQPAEVVRRLRERGIVATVTPPFYSPTYVRLAPGLVTVEEDLERTLVALG
jgi:selenocysteine lyase/cysteine desulfurase